MQIDTILSKLRGKKPELFQSFELESLGIFGSYASGNQNNESDIDILILPKKGSIFTYKKRLNLEAYLNELLAIKKIDLVNQRYFNPIVQYNTSGQVIYV